MATRRNDWALSSVRPVTLLIASGIVLITGILIATGLVAGRLRGEALAATEGELTRIDTVLADTGDKSLRSVETLLQRVGGRLRDKPAVAEAAAAALAEPGLADAMQDGIGGSVHVAAVAVFGADGAVLAASGADAGAAAGAVADDIAALRQHPDRALAIGAPIDVSGLSLVPVARRIGAPGDAFKGAVVGFVPSADLAALYRAVPLGDDGVVSLVRDDGAVLARYPNRPGTVEGATLDGDLRAALRDRTDRTLEQHAGPGPWQLVAVHSLADFPAAVVLSRSGDRALADWVQQILMFGAFAVAGAMGVGVMVYLIARQFRTHAALAAARTAASDMERARLAAEAELLKKERLSVLGQLTATVAHELRNPLSAIRNTLFTLKEMTAAAGLRLDRPISRMERSIERCDRIISDLLEYTKTRELRRAAVNFDRWLAEVLAEQKVPATIELAQQLGAGEALAAIDPERVRRVVINLIDNAAQALEEVPVEQRQRRITVRTGMGEAGLELAIEDTGPGIAAENRERIFEPLFSTKSFGTGLGLATVKQIITEHGGTINIDSEVGVGTCVTIRLLQANEEKAAA